VHVVLGSATSNASGGDIQSGVLVTAQLVDEEQGRGDVLVIPTVVAEKSLEDGKGLCSCQGRRPVLVAVGITFAVVSSNKDGTSSVGYDPTIFERAPSHEPSLDHAVVFDALFPEGEVEIALSLISPSRDAR